MKRLDFKEEVTVFKKREEDFNVAKIVTDNFRKRY